MKIGSILKPRRKNQMPKTPEQIQKLQQAAAERDTAAIKANLPPNGNGANLPAVAKPTAIALLSDMDDVNRTLDEIAPATMQGPMVKFTKEGAFEVQSTGDKLSDTTSFRARCAETFYGYVKFNGEGEMPDRAMGPLYGGFKVRREDLGDTDESQWEPDQFSGKPRDPWIFQFWLVLEDVTTNELYTFVTSSITGTRAVSNLLRHYNRLQETKPGADPIVRLVRSSYEHKKFGTVAIPMFRITGGTVGGPPLPPLGEALNDALPF
jgi:hypothetical protein